MDRTLIFRSPPAVHPESSGRARMAGVQTTAHGRHVDDALLPRGKKSSLSRSSLSGSPPVFPSRSITISQQASKT